MDESHDDLVRQGDRRLDQDPPRTPFRPVNTDAESPNSRSRDRIVLVPVRGFAGAKSRLSDVLDPHQRRTLARVCATEVVERAGSTRTIVVSDDAEVLQWTRERGFRSLRVAATGLNAALHEAVGHIAEIQPVDVFVVHGDLVFADELGDLDTWAPRNAESSRCVTLVPDRHGDGTNVLGLGAAYLDQWRFAYGPGSFGAHCDQARRLGATIRIIENSALAVDIDTPADLIDPRVQAAVDAMIRVR